MGLVREVCEAPETLIDVLTRRARAEPDAPLVTFHGSGTTTVGQMWSLAEEGARTLLSPATGLRPGDAVVTCIRPGTGLLQVLGGAARACLVEVPLAVDAPTGAALDLARGTGARVAVLGSGALAANPGLRELGKQATVVVVDDGGAVDQAGGTVRFEDLRGDPRRTLPRPPSPGDTALVMSTSGTTGRSKGVLLPHFAGVRHARRVADSMAYGPDDVLYNAFPWNHINVRHAGLLTALVSGARLVAVPRFSASSFWDVCREEGVTAFNFMGAVAAILLRCAPDDGDRRHSVTRGYGGPAPAWLAESFLDRFGVRLIEAYACTELGDVTSNRVGDTVPGTAGRPLPEYELRLLGDDDAPVRHGEVGRIAVRARVRHISASGYVGTPAVPSSPDRWFVTGDRGRFDDGGRLVFAGRHSDVVRRRGENISTWEVESAVGAITGVREAAAVGVPSDLTEEDLLVAVAQAPGHRLTAQAIHEWCRRHLPRHSWPRYVLVLDELPRNAATKVRKVELRTPAMIRSACDFEPRAGPGPDQADSGPAPADVPTVDPLAPR